MFREATPVFYGTPNLIEAAIEKVGDPEVNWAVVEGADKARADQVNVVNIQEESWDIQWGQVDGAAGDFAMNALETVVNDLASTKVDVLVTLPIHKEAMRQGAFKHPGQRNTSQTLPTSMKSSCSWSQATCGWACALATLR